MEFDEQVPASVAAAGPAFRDAYIRLRRDYAAQLPARLDEARQALAACLAQPQDDAALVHLRRLVHTMAGTAPTFGHVQLGEHARRVEHAAEALRARAQRQAADFAPVSAALQELLAQAGVA